MDTTKLALLNEGIKKYEKHLEITILNEGCQIEAIFAGVTGFEQNTVFFTLKPGSGEKIGLSYSYDTGAMIRSDRNTAVTITDVFSNRHLRSILMYVWDCIYLENHQDELDVYNQLLHERLPVPIMKTASNGSGNEKKWFKVDNVRILKETIHMKGILSIRDRDYFDQPIVASCIYNYKHDTFTWAFKVSDIDIKREGKEYIESYSETSVNKARLFRIQAEAELQNFILSRNRQKYAELSKVIVDRLNLFEFIVFTPKKDVMGLRGVLRFIIKRVAEVNDNEIVFEVCDLETPTVRLVYDRMFGGLYLKKKKLYKKDKSELVFAQNSDGDKDKFKEIIGMIDDQFPIGRP